MRLFLRQKFFLFFVFLFLLVPGFLSFSQTDTLSIGVLTARDKSFTERTWRPTAQFLSSRISGFRIKIVPLEFQEVQRAIKNEAVDFFLVNPSLYVEAEVLYGAQRIATKKISPKDNVMAWTGGVLFVRNDRKDIHSVADLSGKNLTVISPLSFSYRSAWREFKKQKLDMKEIFKEIVFSKTTIETVRRVEQGETDAGIVRMGALEKMAAEGKIEIDDFRSLKIVDDPLTAGRDFPFAVSTRLYPGWAFAKIKATDNAVAEEMARALMSIEPDHLAAVSGGYGGWTVPLNYQSVHECLKELRLSPYQDYGKVTWGGVVRQYWPWIIALLTMLIFLAAVTGRASMLYKNLVRSQKSLEFERQQYMSIYDSIEEPIYVVDPKKMEILFANDHFKRLVGYDPVGKPCHEMVMGLQMPCPDCPSQQLFQNLGTVLRREVHNPNFEKDFILIEKAIHWPDGRDVRFELAIDVSESKVVERKMRESEQRYRLLADNTLDVIWQIDMNMTFRYLNPAFQQLLGYPPEQVIGQSVSKYTSHEDYERIRTIIEQEVAKEDLGKGFIFESNFISQEGKPVPLEVRGKVVRDDNGNPSGMQGTARDIRERLKMNKNLKAAEDQLLQSEKLAAVGQLSAGIAHEIKNPLAVIMLSIDALEAGLKEVTDPSAKKIRMIRNAAKRANNVIMQLLSFSRRTNAQLVVHGVHEMIDEAVALAQQSAKGKEIVFEKSYCEDQLMIKADNLLLEQALLNVFSNAVDAIPGKGTILIHTALVADDEGKTQAQIRITDTGVGMPPDVVGRIFEPFFTTKDQGKGTGLGLSTVYTIVEKHDGSIKAQSQEGKGTEFIISIPLAEA